MCSIWYARRKLLNELDSYDDYKHEKKKNSSIYFVIFYIPALCSPIWRVESRKKWS